ncbi:MAG: hypothetical protein OIF50_14030 [Flavobacteriaceae bacterium]|nr:hypothetical protein [Flavobacteriaceae bacterium]
MKQQVKQKSLIILLAIGIMGLLGAFGYFYHSKKDAIETLETEKEVLIFDLKNKQATIDSLINSGRFKVVELEASKEEIGVLLDSIGRLNNRVHRLEKFKAEFVRLQQKYAWLRDKNSELYKNNNFLKEQVGDNRSKIANLEANSSEIDRKTEELSAKTKALEEEVKKRSFLNIKEVEATAFRLKSNKEIARTVRASAVAKLRACFMIQANPNLANIRKQVYLQFVDQNGKVLADEGTTTSIKGIECSKKTQLIYNGKDIEVCDYISLQPEQVYKGTYTLNIYESGKKLGTTTFRLK